TRAWTLTTVRSLSSKPHPPPIGAFPNDSVARACTADGADRSSIRPPTRAIRRMAGSSFTVHEREHTLLDDWGVEAIKGRQKPGRILLGGILDCETPHFTLRSRCAWRLHSADRIRQSPSRPAAGRAWHPTLALDGRAVVRFHRLPPFQTVRYR